MKKFLRFIGILFMGISSAVTLLGGVGTTCVALDATKYDSMKAIVKNQWLYIAYVVIGVALGVLGIRATVQMWAGPTHLLDGINYADAFYNSLLGIGSFLIVIGLALLSKALLYQPKREAVKVKA